MRQLTEGSVNIARWIRDQVDDHCIRVALRQKTKPFFLLYRSDNWLSNRVFTSHDNIVDHCCEAWNNTKSLGL